MLQRRHCWEEKTNKQTTTREACRLPDMKLIILANMNVKLLS